MVKLIARQTANNLSIKKWGKASLDIVQSNGKSFIVIQSLSLFVDEVLFYDNNNMLLHVSCPKVADYLYTPKNFLSKPKAEISETVFDDKYRKVVEYDEDGERLVSIIDEESGRLEFCPTKWKDILNVHDDIATISFTQKGTGRILQSLVRFKQNLYGNELVAQEITHIKESLYKYRQNSHLYNLYNTTNRLSSDDSIGYSDIEFISDQLAMGVINNAQWDFIKTYPEKDAKILKVVHTSYEQPVFDNDIISIVDYDDNDEETRYKINFSGTKLSEGNVLDLSIESGEVVPPVENIKPIEEVKVTDSPIVTIGRFVFISDDSVKVSKHSNIIYSKKSLKKPCEIDKGVICWILAKDNVVIITKKDGISDYRRTILYKKDLPTDFGSFEALKGSKWHIENCQICAKKEDVLNTAIEVIKTKLQEKVDSIEIKQQTNESLATNDTKETLKLKAIYHFLQQQGFDKDAVYKTLYILFPSIEQYIDLTNVRITEAELCEKIDKHSRTRDLILSDTSHLIKMLNLNEKELAILNYYTQAKGLSISAAIEYINEESPTGANVTAKYNELMQLGDILSNERKQLKKLIIEDLVNGYANLADTSEILKPIAAVPSPILNQSELSNQEEVKEFTIDETKTIEAVIKDKIFKFRLNDIIPFKKFENKKVYYSKHDLHYVLVGKDILIFISKNKAVELDKEHPHNISLRGNGEDRRFSQTFTHINEAIKNQRENYSRIFVFEHNDDKTCKFYDELQYLDYDIEKEDGREIIMFKMKSLHRFNTENI